MDDAPKRHFLMHSGYTPNALKSGQESTCKTWKMYLNLCRFISVRYMSRGEYNVENLKTDPALT